MKGHNNMHKFMIVYRSITIKELIAVTHRYLDPFTQSTDTSNAVGFEEVIMFSYTNNPCVIAVQYSIKAKLTVPHPIAVSIAKTCK